MATTPMKDAPQVGADAVVQAVRVECYRRARTKSDWARRVDLELDHHKPHDEVRAYLELGRHEYKRIRRWMEDARKEARDAGMSFDEALREHEDRQVDLITRFFLLRQMGVSREEARQRLGLSHDGYDLTNEWLRDALAVVRMQRGRP